MELTVRPSYDQPFFSGACLQCTNLWLHLHQTPNIGDFRERLKNRMEKSSDVTQDTVNGRHKTRSELLDCGLILKNHLHIGQGFKFGYQLMPVISINAKRLCQSTCRKFPIHRHDKCAQSTVLRNGRLRTFDGFILRGDWCSTLKRNIMIKWTHSLEPGILLLRFGLGWECRGIIAASLWAGRISAETTAVARKRWVLICDH